MISMRSSSAYRGLTLLELIIVLVISSLLLSGGILLLQDVSRRYFRVNSLIKQDYEMEVGIDTFAQFIKQAMRIEERAGGYLLYIPQSFEQAYRDEIERYWLGERNKEVVLIKLLDGGEEEVLMILTNYQLDVELTEPHLLLELRRDKFNLRRSRLIYLRLW